MDSNFLHFQRRPSDFFTKEINRHASKVRRGTFNIRERLPRQTKFWICVYVPTLPRGKVVKVNLPRRTFETLFRLPYGI